MGSISQVAFLVGIPLNQEEGLMCCPQMDWTVIRPLRVQGLLQGATLPAPGEVPGMIRRLSEQDPECLALSSGLFDITEGRDVQTSHFLTLIG